MQEQNVRQRCTDSLYDITLIITNVHTEHQTTIEVMFAERRHIPRLRSIVKCLQQRSKLISVISGLRSVRFSSRIYRTPLCTHKTSNNQTSKPAAA